MVFERIVLLKDNKGVSFADISRATGISKSNFKSWESKNILPSSEAIIKMAKYFHVTTDYLLTGENEPHPSGEASSEPILTETEEILLEAYRNADKETRIDILKKLLDATKTG